VFTSPLCKFRIGPEKEEIITNSEAIASLSPSFDKVICLDDNSPGTLVADFPNLELDDFIQVLEFAYTDDYTTVVPSDSQKVDDSPEADDSQEADDNSMLDGSQEVDDNRMLDDPFVSPGPPSSEAQIPAALPGLRKLAANPFGLTPMSKPLKIKCVRLNLSLHVNIKERDNYRSIFLCHASMYIFANKWKIKRLKRIALRKLAQSISMSSSETEMTKDLVNLVRHV
jgi:hypothetical protein